MSTALHSACLKFQMGNILAGGHCQPLHDCVAETFSHNNLHKTSFFIFKKDKIFFPSIFSAYKEQILLRKLCSEQQGARLNWSSVFFPQMSEQSLVLAVGTVQQFVLSSPPPTQKV